MNIPDIWTRFGEQLYGAFEYDGYEDFETAIPYVLTILTDGEKADLLKYVMHVTSQGYDEEELTNILTALTDEWYLVVNEHSDNSRV